MASACVNNISLSPENFLDCSPGIAPYPTYGWLSPRISFSREATDEDTCASRVNKSDGCNYRNNIQRQPLPGQQQKEQIHFIDCSQMADSDLELSTGDFEFRLEDPVTMLPADELFLDGKLVPLQPSTVKAPVNDLTFPETRLPETAKKVRTNEISATDPYLFSPKAPRCSSRWKELLGWKKLYQSKSETHKASVLSSSSFSSSSSSSSTNSKPLKIFLHSSSKSLSSSSSSNYSDASSLSQQLLKDSDSESVSISSSRLSLSSSSSGHDHEDLPRLSLDSDKPNPNLNQILLHRNPNSFHPRIKTVKPSSNRNPRSMMDNMTAARVGPSPMRKPAGEFCGISNTGLSVDSPRMNSSGKIVFHSLERSSSSPSSFHGGPKLKLRGMERSYSSNVRVTPVLNVPVCSLRRSSKSVSVFGFGQLFSSPQKRENGGHENGNGGVGGGSSNRVQHVNSIRHRKDRT